MPLETHRLLHADEAIPALPGHTVGHFWRWAYSDLHCNTVRPIFAEYVVGTLLGIDLTLRVEWDAVDHVFEGHGVEVKSGAHVQSWAQARASRIVFDIARKRAYDPRNNSYGETPVRSAAVYVFCVWPVEDRAVSPLDLTRWRFRVLSTARVDQAFGAQKTVTLSRIEPLTEPCDYTTLRERVRAALAESSTTP